MTRLAIELTWNRSSSPLSYGDVYSRGFKRMLLIKLIVWLIVRSTFEVKLLFLDMLDCEHCLPKKFLVRILDKNP